MTGNYIGFKPTVNSSVAEGVFNSAEVFENVDYSTWPTPDVETEIGLNLQVTTSKNATSVVAKTSLNVSATNPYGFDFNSDGTYFISSSYLVAFPSVYNQISSYNLSTPWSLTSAASNSSFIPAQSLNPVDIVMKPDGSRFYLLSYSPNTVFQYSMTTPFNLSTSVYDNVAFSVSTQENNPLAMCFKSDGLKMFVIGSQGDDVNEYTLSQSWNVATASYTNVYTLPTTRDTWPTGITFNSDGTKLFVSGNTTPGIYEYKLSTPWNLSTLSYVESLRLPGTTPAKGLRLKENDKSVYFRGGFGDNQRINEIELVKASSITPYGLFNNVATSGSYFATPDERLFLRYAETSKSVAFSPDGTKGYITDLTRKVVLQVNMSIPFDIGSGTITSKPLYINATAVPGTISGLDIKSDGTKFYIHSSSIGFVQYSLSTPWDISSGVIEKSSRDYPAFYYNSMTTFKFNEDGTRIHILGTNNFQQLATIVLTTPWDIGSLSCYFEVNSTGLHYSPNGSILYTSNQTDQKIHQVNLGEPFNVNWPVSQANVSIVARGEQVNDLFVGSGGQKLYFIGLTTSRLYQYSLSTPYNITTAVYDNVFFQLEKTATGITFKSDGSSFYVTAYNNMIYTHKMSQSWNVATVSTGIFNHINFETDTRSLRLSSNGHRAYTFSGSKLTQYNLSTPYQINTASYASNTTISSNGVGTADFNCGMTFSPNGSLLFFGNNSAVSAPMSKYFLSTPWDITTATLSQQTAPLAIWGTSSSSQFTMSDDGYIIYIAHGTGTTLTQYVLKQAWNVRTIDTNTTFISSDVFTTYNTLDVQVSPDGNNMMLYVYTATAPNSAGVRLLHYRLNKNNWVQTANTVSSSLSLGFGSFTTGDAFSIKFSANGHKLYALGQNTTPVIEELSLPTPYSLTSATRASRPVLSIFNYDATGPVGIAFSNNGNYMFTTAYNNGDASQKRQIRRYYLHTPWDLSSARPYTGGVTNAGAYGIRFSANGHKMYIANNTNQIIQYNLRINFDAHSATYERQYAPSSDTAGLTDLEFNGNGTIMYTVGTTSRAITMYNLSSAWNIGTASISTSVNLNIAANRTITIPNGIVITANGTSMYVAGSNSTPANIIAKFNLPANGIVNSSVTFESAITPATTPDSVSIANNESSIYYGDSVNDRFYQYNMTTAGNLASATIRTFQASANILAGVSYNNPAAMYLSSNGRFLWCTDYTISGTNQFYLTNPSDILSMKPVNSTNCAVGDSSISKIDFSHDGNRFYALGSTNDTLYEFDTLAPFDTTTLTYTGRSRYMNNSDIRGFAFSGNGLFLYSSDYTARSIYQFNAQDISSNGYLAQTYVTSAGVSITTSGKGQTGTTITGAQPFDFQFANSTQLLLATASGYVNQIVMDVPYTIASVQVSTTNSSAYQIASTSSRVSAFMADEKVYITDVGKDVISQHYIPNGYVSNLVPIDGIRTSNVRTLTSLDIDANGDYIYLVSGTDGRSTNAFSFIQTSNGVINSLSVVNTTKYVNTYDIGINTNGAWGLALHGNTIYDGFSTIGPSMRAATFGFMESNNLYTVYPTSRSKTFQGTRVGTIVDFDVKQSNVIVQTSSSISELELSNTNNISSVKSKESIASASYTSIYVSSNNDLYLSTTSNNIHQYKLSTADDLSSKYALLPTGNLGRNLLGITFKTDGSKLYVVDASAIYQYSLSEAWNAFTATYESKTFSFSTQTSAVSEVYINNDGTKIFVNSTTALFSYTMSTPWDVSTATYDTRTYSTTANTQSSLTSFTFKPDGTKLYISGSETNTVETITEFNLQTAWDLRSALYSNTWFSNAQTRKSSQALTSFEFNNDGTKIFSYNAEISLRSYILSTPYDISTIRRETINLPLAPITASPTGVRYANSKLFVIDSTTDAILKLESFSNNNIEVLEKSTSGSFHGVRTPVSELLSYGHYIKSDGTKAYIIGTTNRKVYQFSMSTPYDVGTSTFDYISSNTVTAQDTSPYTLSFKSDGTQCYILGDTNNRVFQYNMSQAWNVATMSYSNYSSNTLAGGQLVGFYFKEDGLSFYYNDVSNSRSFQYNMSQAWNVATASYSSNVSFGNIVTTSTLSNPYGLTFNDDGSSMYVAFNGGTVVQFTLDTSWNVATAVPRTTVSDSYDVAGSTGDISFGANGTYLYITDVTNDTVLVKKLSTPFNIKTVDGKLDLATGEDLPGGMVFASDGTGIYVTGSTLDAVFYYPLTVPYQVNSFISGTERSYSHRPEALGVAYDLAFSPNGSIMYITNGDRVYQYNLQQAWNVETSRYMSNVVANSTFGVVSGLDFSSNGTVMYTTSYSSNYSSIGITTLSTAWNVVTSNAATTSYYRGNSVYSTGYSASGPTNFIPGYIQGLQWSRKGNYLTMIGGSGSGAQLLTQIKTLAPFTLTNNVATSDISSTFYFSGADATLSQTDVNLIDTGSGVKMYVLNNTNDEINEYTINR
jgi:sugar lactone lactonase YvrE